MVNRQTTVKVYGTKVIEMEGVVLRACRSRLHYPLFQLLHSIIAGRSLRLVFRTREATEQSRQ